MNKLNPARVFHYIVYLDGKIIEDKFFYMLPLLKLGVKFCAFGKQYEVIKVSPSFKIESPLGKDVVFRIDVKGGESK